MLQLADPMLAVILFIILLGMYSIARFVVAWFDSRSLRRQEELNGMQWRRMR